MALFEPDEFRLYGDHFICNIALGENLPGGLVAVERDPRKLRKKPDAYVARVERCADGCKIVKPGHKIVIERFEWLQYDLDDERIIARETDVLILGSDEPAPGVFVIKQPNRAEEYKKRNNLYIPDSMHIETVEKEIYHGKVLFSNEVNLNGEEIKPGQLVWVRKSERNQFRLGKDLIVVRGTPEEVLMIGETSDEKQKIPLQVA